MKKLLAVLIIVSLLLSACLTDDPLKTPFQSYTPSNLADGWSIATPDDEGIDGEALKDVYKYVHDEDNVWQIRSLLVFRNNKLVAESYMKDANDRTNPSVIWSCTKQIVGILTGIAVEQGLISIDDTISDYLPQVSSMRHADKEDITIEHLLTMRSGINYNNDGDNDPLLNLKVSNSLEYVLDFGMQAPPGTNFRYKDSDPHIMSAILQERTGKTTRDWAQEVLFGKIGINRLEWRTYPKDGITLGGWGILTTSRELAKIGQLVLNDGMWGSEEIVNSSWINAITTTKVPHALDDSDYNLPGVDFGYLWWIDNNRDIVYMWGHGGQFVFINKTKALLVVIKSETGDAELKLNQGLSIYDWINGITY